MSHVGDTSNQTTNEVSPGLTSQSGVATDGFSQAGGPVSKKLKFNENGFPIGPNSAKSSSRLGCLARTYIPISYNAWPQVDEKYKEQEQLWKLYKDEYPDVKESQRNILMQKAGHAWRKFKGKLRGNLEGDDLIKWKEKVPKNIKSEDWEAYCNHEATENQKELRMRNKAIKDSCERKSTHNTGRDGYARAAEKWQENHIKMPKFPVWGGQQGPCHTLADVGKGGFMYWHDDFLPPLDDTQEA